MFIEFIEKSVVSVCVSDILPNEFQQPSRKQYHTTFPKPPSRYPFLLNIVFENMEGFSLLFICNRPSINFYPKTFRHKDNQ